LPRMGMSNSATCSRSGKSEQGYAVTLHAHSRLFTNFASLTPFSMDIIQKRVA